MKTKLAIKLMTMNHDTAETDDSDIDVEEAAEEEKEEEEVKEEDSDDPWRLLRGFRAVSVGV